eukprot:PhM_4_TR18485/c0_g1_i1/m.65504
MSDVEAVLVKIRMFIVRTRIRVAEYFHDFDRLRSGAITREQFRRCLAMCGIIDTITDEDCVTLYNHFEHKRKPQHVDYPAFVTSVLSESGPVKVSTEVTVNVSESDRAILDQILPIFGHEAVTKGLILKNSFKDFDKHSTGVVSLAQFRRGIPFKVSEMQFGVLQRAYQDLQGNIRYLHFCAEVMAAARIPSAGRRVSGDGTNPANSLLVKSGPAHVDYDTAGLILELKKQVKQYRIRVEDPFSDYDRLRSGMITPAQFQAGLGKIKLQKLTLSTQHLQMLTEHYQTTDDQGVAKVPYGRFVDDMDSVFTEKHLEKNPTKTIAADNGMFSTRAEVNQLSPEDSRQLENVINRIRTQVRTRRVFLKPFFQDFDRAITGVYQTQACTRERFERVLALNGMQLNAHEYSLLERRYEVMKAGNSTQRINYNLFCADVDPPTEMPSVTHASAGIMATVNQKAHPTRSVDQIIEDIQLHCYDKRLRLAEFLRDFDPLRNGSLNLAKFSTGLSIAGIKLDDAELKKLLEAFGSQKVPGAINWVSFADRVDELFTTKGLESNPAKHHVSAQALLEKRATEHMPKGADNEEIVHVLNKIAEFVRNRGVLLPPFFKDFDRHNTGRISATQFQQVISRHGFPVNAAQVAKLTLAYSDPRDPNVVNVRLFVKAVDSSEDTSKIREIQQQRDAADAAHLNLTRSTLAASAPKPHVDIELVIVRLRSHVARERVRVREFFYDTDRLRKGVCPLVRFGPCVDQIGAKLSSEELQAVIDRYARYPANQEPVADYVAFCSDIDPSSGNIGLEKSPTKTAPKVEARSRFANGLEANTVTAEQRMKLEHTIDRLRSAVKARRLMLQPFFTDFDKLRKERVTGAQFEAALDKMKLIQLSQSEVSNLLACLRDERGDIDYAQFIRLVDN